MACSVRSCRNVRRLLPPNTNISFHRFPREKNMFQLWIKIIGRANENKSWKRNVLCSEHFYSEDLVKRGNKYFVRENAIPKKNIKNVTKSSSTINPDDTELEITSPRTNNTINENFERISPRNEASTSNINIKTDINSINRRNLIRKKYWDLNVKYIQEICVLEQHSKMQQLRIDELTKELGELAKHRGICI